MKKEVRSPKDSSREISLLSIIKSALLQNIPAAFQGSYESPNDMYHTIVGNYFPENKQIYIGNTTDDMQRIYHDMHISVRGYKVAGRKEIDKRKLEIELG